MGSPWDRRHLIRASLKAVGWTCASVSNPRRLEHVSVRKMHGRRCRKAGESRDQSIMYRQVRIMCHTRRRGLGQGSAGQRAEDSEVMRMDHHNGHQCSCLSCVGAKKGSARRATPWKKRKRWIDDMKTTGMVDDSLMAVNSWL